MTWRRIAIYYGLAVLLGGYFFLFEERQSEQAITVAQEPTVPKREFLPLQRGEIQEMQLSRAKEGTLHFKHNGQAWEVVEPAGAAVTSAVVASFLEDLTPEKEIRIIDANPDDLAIYGLDKPTSTIIVKGVDGAQETTVLVGSLNPASSAYYARRADAPEVVLLGYNIGYYGDLMFQSARPKT